MEVSLTHLMLHPNAMTQAGLNKFSISLLCKLYSIQYIRRYMNHGHVNYNLIVTPPIMTGEKLRIGFVAKQNISKGDEMFWNYGLNDKSFPWLSSNAKLIGTKLQNGKHCGALCIITYSY